MTRHTTFRYCLDPTSEQRSILVRHAGASRFAFNQCLRMVKDALSAPTSASDKVVADRWYPSSQICSLCQACNNELTLADRVFTCPEGHSLDRDLNAAINLAFWGEERHRVGAHTQSRVRGPEARAPVKNARRRKGSGRHLARVGETGPSDAGTDVQAELSA